MSVIPQRTRAQLRYSLAQLIGALYQGRALSTTTVSSAATNLIDTKLRGGTNDHRGKWAYLTSGALSGEVQQVSSFDGASTLTLSPGYSGTPASGISYELYDEDMPPSRLHEFLDMAIQDMTPRALVEGTSIAHHAVTDRHRVFPLASTILGVYKVERRSSVKVLTVDNADAVWTAASNVTATAETEDIREGAGAARLNIAAGLSAGANVAYRAITAIDLRRYTHIECWVKSTVALAAGDYQIVLDDTAAIASPVENLNIPALSADTWTFIRIALANPESDSAIISVGVVNVVDKGAHHLLIDGIQAIDASTERWETVPAHFWYIDKGRTELLLTSEGSRVVGYSLLKLHTLARPTLLSADATTCEVNPEFVMARAAAYAFSARADRAGDRAEASMLLTDYWMRKSTEMMSASPSLPAGTKLVT